MKNLIFLLLTLVLFSGCASYPNISRIGFGETTDVVKSGTVVFLGVYKNKNLENIPSNSLEKIDQVCLGKSYKITSWEFTQIETVAFIALVFTQFENKVSFECLK